MSQGQVLIPNGLVTKFNYHQMFSENNFGLVKQTIDFDFVIDVHFDVDVDLDFDVAVETEFEFHFDV